MNWVQKNVTTLFFHIFRSWMLEQISPKIRNVPVVLPPGSQHIADVLSQHTESCLVKFQLFSLKKDLITGHSPKKD